MKRIFVLLLCLLMVFSLAACGEKEPEPEVTEPVETEPQLTPEEQAENMRKKLVTVYIDGNPYEMEELSTAKLEEIGFKPEPVWLTNELGEDGPVYKNDKGEQMSVVFGNKKGTIAAVSVGLTGLSENTEYSFANVMFVNGIKIGMSKESITDKLAEFQITEQKLDDLVLYIIQTDKCSFIISFEDDVATAISLGFNNGVLEFEKPEANDDFAKFMMNGKEYNIDELSIFDFIKDGLARKSEWNREFNGADIEGYCYVNTDFKESYLYHIKNKMVIVGTGVQNEAPIDMKLFGGLKVGMTMSQVWPIIQEYLPTIVEGHDVGDCDYLINNGRHTIVLRMVGGTLEEMYLTYDVMVSEEENIAYGVDLYNRIYDLVAERNDPTKWVGADVEANYETDVFEVVIDGERYNFNELTVEKLQDAKILGTEYQRMDVEPTYLRLFASESGTKFNAVHNKKHELLYAEFTDGEHFEFFGGIKPGTTKEELIAAVANKSIKIKKVDKTTEDVLLKTENNVMHITLTEGVVSKVVIINSKLAAALVPDTSELPQENLLPVVPNDPSEAVDLDMNLFNQFVLNGKTFKLGDVMLSDLQSIGFNTDRITGTWENDKEMTASGVIYSTANKEQLKVLGKKLIVVGAERSPFADVKHADLELFGGIKIGVSEEYALSVIEKMKHEKVSDSFGDVYYIHHDEYSLVFFISDGIVDEMYLAISIEVGLNLPYRLQVQGINDKYHEELYDKNVKKTWYGFDDDAEYEGYLAGVKIKGQDFVSTEITLTTLADLGFKYERSITSSSKPQYLGMVFVDELGNEIHVITSRDMHIECINLQTPKSGIIPDIEFFGGLKIGMNYLDARKIVNTSKMTDNCKVTIKTEEQTMTISVRNGIVKDIKLVNNDLAGFPPVTKK